MEQNILMSITRRNNDWTKTQKTKIRDKNNIHSNNFTVIFAFVFRLIFNFNYFLKQ